MKTRKALLALAAAALGGCAAYPYDDYAYRDGYYRDAYGRTYYGPPAYYAAPTVGFGITYSDHDYWRHRHYR
jgi:hypothetical protein